MTLPFPDHSRRVTASAAVLASLLHLALWLAMAWPAQAAGGPGESLVAICTAQGVQVVALGGTDAPAQQAGCPCAGLCAGACLAPPALALVGQCWFKPARLMPIAARGRSLRPFEKRRWPRGPPRT